SSGEATRNRSDSLIKKPHQCLINSDAAFLYMAEFQLIIA
ncbi:MAG: hypothetical protein ACJA0H_001059, partial [Francisellaceae bacterium]